MDFRLLKLVLIDSYSAGRVVELPVDGGAVLTGRNGRGKTTLLQLIPIFYGENPTRIVATETNRLDFNSFYLPRLTSYIIFEYQRADHGVRMVILHASSTGTERRYAFARSSYRPDLFLSPDGCNIIQVPDLRRTFHQSGIHLSHSISAVAEYRSIIQGKVGSGKQAVKQRQLSLDYAFVGPGQHLTHIEKIVSGMFLRSTNFVHLQGMVVSCIGSGADEVMLQSERLKIESWPDRYDAYNTAMAASDVMSELLDRESRLVAVEAELGCIHARALHLLAHLDGAAIENRRQRAAHATLAEQEQQTYASTSSAIHVRRDTAIGEAKQCERRADALDKQRAEYGEKDLPAKAQRLRQEPEIQQRLADLTDRRGILLGAQERIDLEYGRRLNALDRAHTETDRAAAAARAALSATFDPRIQALEATAAIDLEALAGAHRAQREVIESNLRTTLERKGQCSQRLSAPQPDPEAVALRDTKRDELDARTAEHHQAEQLVHQRHDAYTKAKTAHAVEEQRGKRLAEQRASLKQRRQRCLLHKSPGETSLLHFLRTSRPEWIFNIAKVIRDDVLTREDLSPELVDSLPTLYGVALDLGRVPAHLAADEEALQREIEEVDALLARTDDDVRLAEQSLAATERARRQTEEALTLARHECQRAETIVTSVRGELTAAERRVDQARKQAARLARDQFQEVERAEADLHRDLLAADATAKMAIEERQRQRAADRRNLEAQRQSLLDADALEQAARRAREASDRASIEAECAGALSAAGVDTKILADLDSRASEARQELARIEQSRAEVHQWQHWQAHEWPLKEDFLRDGRAARAQEALARAEALAEDTRWQRRWAELGVIKKRLDSEDATIDESIRAVRARLEGFRSYPADPQVQAQAYDPGWVLEALVAQANTSQTEAAALLRTIIILVERIKRAFVSHRGSGPEDFYNTQSAAMPLGATPRQWVAVFGTWFASAHDQWRHILAMDAGLIASSIDRFHRDLAAFHRDVSGFNRELQKSMDSSLDFESITGLKIEVESMITTLRYWEPIAAIAEEHRAWLALEGQELPPPVFAATLRKLLEQWETREGIRAELPNLIRIKGSVVENGRTRKFHNAADLERVSSNGLSYLILCTIFIAFVNRIRGSAPVTLVWALDELKDLDIGNIEALLSVLGRNKIVLVSAFPDPDAEILALFPNRFTVDAQQRLLETQVFDPAAQSAPLATQVPAVTGGDDV